MKGKLKRKTNSRITHKIGTFKKNVLLKTMGKMSHNVEKVEWEDITFFKGFYEKKELKDLVTQRIQTIGHLVEEDEETLVIALSLELTEPNRVIDLIKIPKKNILIRDSITI